MPGCACTHTFAPHTVVHMRTNTEITRLLDEAQQHNLCATSTDNNQRRKFARRVACGELITPHPRMYVRPEFWENLNPTQRKRAVVQTLAILHPNVVFAAESAMCMFDVEQPYDIHPENEITVASTSHSGTHAIAKSGTIRHTVCMRNLPTVTIEGAVVTSFARTLFDCARLLPFELALPMADAAARKNFDVSVITQFPVSSVDEANKVARVVSGTDARSENGGESRARAVMENGGFMRPHLQYTFPNPNNPDFPLRVDFIWILSDGTIIVAEYDGMAKYGATWTEVNTHVSKQYERDEYLKRCGVTTIVHFNFDDVIHPERLYQKLEAAGVPRIR